MRNRELPFAIERGIFLSCYIPLSRVWSRNCIVPECQWTFVCSCKRDQHKRAETTKSPTQQLATLFWCPTTTLVFLTRNSTLIFHDVCTVVRLVWILTKNTMTYNMHNSNCPLLKSVRPARLCANAPEIRKRAAKSHVQTIITKMVQHSAAVVYSLQSTVRNYGTVHWTLILAHISWQTFRQHPVVNGPSSNVLHMHCSSAPKGVWGCSI